MGLMGIGYGSEFHLLRMLGRHRAQFDRELLARLKADNLPAESVEWLDSPFNPKGKTRDGEWKSVDFLADKGGEDWKRFWPDKRAGQPNRDGVPSWAQSANCGRKMEGNGFWWKPRRTSGSLRRAAGNAARVMLVGGKSALHSGTLSSIAAVVPSSGRSWKLFGWVAAISLPIGLPACGF